VVAVEQLMAQRVLLEAMAAVVVVVVVVLVDLLDIRLEMVKHCLVAVVVVLEMLMEQQVVQVSSLSNGRNVVKIQHA
jgi:hypothetical protein